MKNKLMLTLTLCTLSLSASAQETYELTTDKPERYGLVPKGFVVSTFRLWVPDGETPQYVLFVPPAFGGGSFDILKVGWKKFCQEHHLAVLLGSFKKTEGKSGPDSGQVEQWSGKLALDALKQLAADAGKPELADAPLLLYGFHGTSAGMACNLAAWKPERVAAVVTNGCHFAEPKKAYKVPCLVFGIGGEQFNAARRNNALWCQVPREQQVVLQNFFASIIAHRKSGKDESWIGNLKTKTITAKTEETTSTKDTVWLPDEDFARTWQLAVGGGNE